MQTCLFLQHMQYCPLMPHASSLLTKLSMVMMQ